MTNINSIEALSGRHKFQLVTYWDTIVYFDEKHDGFRHGKIGEAPDNLVAVMSGSEVALVYVKKSGESSINSENFVISWDRGDIAFSRDGRFAGAERHGQVAISRAQKSDETYFRVQPLSSDSFERFLALAGQGNQSAISKGSRPVKLFWWRRDVKVNFGDAISPRIVAAVSRRDVVYSTYEEAEIYAVGSILAGKPHDNAEAPIYVWGSGIMEMHEVFSKRYRYCAVRGPLTRACVTRSNTLAAGDPGLLVSRFWRTNGGKKYRWGHCTAFYSNERRHLSESAKKYLARNAH